MNIAWYTIADPRSMKGSCAVSQLAEWLVGAMKRKKVSRSKLQELTGLSKTGLREILVGNTKVPDLSTLDTFAEIFDVPLVFLIEKCGFNPGLSPSPSDRAAYVADLIARQPEYREAAENLLALLPDDFEAARRHIEALRIAEAQQADQAGGTP